MTDNDDRPIGSLLSRREALGVMGALGATGMLTLAGYGPAHGRPRSLGIAPGTCIVRPEETEGPYFVDDKLNRSDIRADSADGSVRPGALLHLTFNVSRIAGAACAPLAGAVVDVWQCDHLGVYSDVRDPGFNTVGKKFLRGYQVTDTSGVARFTTIYPGWYESRTVHAHFKIRSSPSSRPGFEFTSQLYFDDALTDRVHGQQPYAVKGKRSVRNKDDGIFADGGSQLILPVTDGSGSYAGTFDIALHVV